MSILEQVISIVSKEIKNNTILEKSVCSIYGIGGIAKMKENTNDIDLNIFLNNNNYEVLENILVMQNSILDATGKEVDVNIVDMESFHHNMANSDYFPLKFRHSLFLYELNTVKCLIYGDDIIAGLKFHYSDLIIECLKTCFTLVHRFNKPLLTSPDKISNTQAKKFCRYACEFALIFKGVENPYIKFNSKEFLQHYPELTSFSELLNQLWEPSTDRLALSDQYNFIVTISHKLLERYLFLVNNPDNAHIEYGQPSYESWFSFPNHKEHKLFKENYESIPDYKKIL